jgi:hypothetical protein
LLGLSGRLCVTLRTIAEVHETEQDRIAPTHARNRHESTLSAMRIIVLAVAILPRLRIGGRQLLQSELAGPTEIEQLGDTIRSTAPC